MNLYMGMGIGDILHMVKKTGGGIASAASFTSFQGYLTKYLALDGNGSDSVHVGGSDDMGGAKVGTGSAPDTQGWICHHFFA
jgi:hypothetical protein